MKTTAPKSPPLLWEHLLPVALGCLALAAHAETLYVDAHRGRDANPGSAERPLQTLSRVAELVNAKTAPGVTTVKLRPGVFALSAPVVFENQRAYSPEQRLTLEALVLPDDSEWQPGAMPTVLSLENPRSSTPPGQPTQTYGLKIKMSHVTVRGMKFLGNPWFNNWYCPLECLQTNLTDILVTQCMFAGNPDTLDIYCGVITDGHEFVVDHCIFSGCQACAVFWDGDRGVVGRRNAMRYCIVEGAKISSVWTCETDEDFEFHHNIVTGSEYFWLRKWGAPKTYRVRDCVVSGNKHYSGYGVAAGATGPSGPEISFVEERVEKDRAVTLQRSRASKHYLHVVPGTPGSQLGSGLFLGQQRERAMDRVTHIEEGIIREIPAAPRLCDSLEARKEKVDIGDCKLYCEQEGQDPTLVLLHGGPGSTHHHFHPVFSRAREYARVVYYDQRGCGLSDFAPGKGYCVDQAVEDLDRLRHTLGIEQWVVLGHSYGGLLAQCYALKYPERLKGLVLVCASTGLPIEFTSRDHQFISPREREKMDQIRATLGLSVAQRVYNLHLNGDWKRQNYYRPTREQIAQSALYGCVSDFDHRFDVVMSRSANGVDLDGAFAHCPIPTLILEGKWDMSWAAGKPEALQKNHPRAKLVLFEASAHDPFEDEPERFFVTLKEFLTTLIPIPSEIVASWKHEVTQWRQSKTDPQLTGPLSPEETRAIEEFRRLEVQVRAGQRYEDASTPLHAVLTRFSKWQQEPEENRLPARDVFRAPVPPEKPGEGSLWPVFVGSGQREDTYFLVYSKGRWLWFGNLGNSGDWRPHRAALEELAKRNLKQP